MSSTPPFPTTSDQRLLAAIVFTDVVGFTKRMQVEEAKTLKLLERDFVSMRAFCAMHSGRVIKTTGDGLLLFFNSAVQAVEWSLKAQRHFTEQAEELPTAEVLKHRVGVHLGDIVLAGNDVMGDGVNVASRVMGESPPGGICISQDVYAVVKNKMKLDVLKLEPRQLKNVNEPMQMYRVLLEAPSAQMMGGSRSPVATPKPAAPPAPAWRRWAFLGGAVVLLGVAGLALYQAQKDHERELAGSQDMRAALNAAVQARSVAPGTTSEAAPAAGSSANPAPKASAPAVPATPSAPAVDFAKLTASRPAGEPTTDDEKRLLQAANDSVATLLAWTPGALKHYTKENPLFVRPLRSASFQNSTVFTDTKGRLNFAEGGAVRPRAWQDLPAGVQGAIIASLLRNAPAPLPPEIIRGGDAFAYLNRLPEMAEMLIRERK